MKTRNGFVSNSSSSSFVLLGFIPDKKNVNEKYMLDSEEYEKFYTILGKNDYFQINEGDYEGAVGKLISDNDGCGDEAPKKIPLANLDKWATEVSEFFKVDKSRIMLYTGTRCC